MERVPQKSLTGSGGSSAGVTRSMQHSLLGELLTGRLRNLVPDDAEPKGSIFIFVSHNER